MGKNDLIQLAIGFALVSLMVAIAVAFPVYGIYEGKSLREVTYVRCPIWDPPNLLARPQRESAPEDRQPGSVPAVDVAPGGVPQGDFDRYTVKASPIFMDALRYRTGPRKNIFGTLTAYLVIAYIAFAIWKWCWRG